MLRVKQTLRLLNGENVSLRNCLFISPEAANKPRFLDQLSQPEWDENDTGRIVITKTPGNATSPDMFDATCLAFAHDSRNGIRLSSMNR